MRKIVTVQLWVDDDWAQDGDAVYMNDKSIKEDITNELKHCWHNFDIINYDVMEIINERCDRSGKRISV